MFLPAVSGEVTGTDEDIAFHIVLDELFELVEVGVRV